MPVCRPLPYEVEREIGVGDASRRLCAAPIGLEPNLADVLLQLMRQRPQREINVSQKEQQRADQARQARGE